VTGRLTSPCLTTGDMPYGHVVVDGSNIATEGRSQPSLAQLDEAVRAFRKEHPGAEVTVVVDATFAHRIDPSESLLLEEAVAHAELVSPPAGAIGRGDAFLLRIAEKTGATVLSNDSFQEFHGEHEWLFASGRLVGGKPVPGVGWIFTPRTPVRGPKSREATKQSRRSASREAFEPLPTPKAPPPRRQKAAGGEEEGVSRGRRGGRGAKKRPPDKAAEEPGALRDAIEAATEEAVEPTSGSGRSRSPRQGGPPPQAVNDPLTFITFIAEHPLGAAVEGEVESFTSHGAFALVDEARCYVPLSGLGDPPPTRARDVLKRGETRTFVLRALDPQRRGIELALPEVGAVTGAPTDETVEADMAVATGSGRGPARGRRAAPSDRGQAGRADHVGRGKRAGASTETAAKKRASAKKAPAKTLVKKAAGRQTPGKTPVKKAAHEPRRSSARDAAAKNGLTKKGGAPKREAATKKTPTKKAPAKKASAQRASAKKAPAREAPTKKAAAKKAGAKVGSVNEPARRASSAGRPVPGKSSSAGSRRSS
jgi:Zc3h12a-like Ribonuclease NYN domain